MRLLENWWGVELVDFIVAKPYFTISKENHKCCSGETLDKKEDSHEWMLDSVPTTVMKTEVSNVW